jgi:hypothetical protein
MTDDDDIDYEALEADLNELERTDPDVAAAAEAYRTAVDRLLTSARPGGDMTDMTKVTINMPVELHAKLRDMAHADGISVTEMMRRAVALYQAMWHHSDDERGNP